MAEDDDVSLVDQSSYLSATAECDLVMKGGITSGVVYPLAVCRLATKHRLRQVGGTSAGAIAAAAAAAAEYGREKEGFVKLARLPSWLAAPAPPPAQGCNLRSLFRPAPITRKTFSILMALVERGSKPAKGARLVGRLVAAHPISALGSALPGLQLAALASELGGRAAPVGVVGGLLVAVVGLTIGLIVAALMHARRVLPENNFGLCPGSPGVTDWLAGLLDDLAGLETGGTPLTFGDLRRKGIELRMLTTALTLGLPFRLPFEERTFLYDSGQFRKLFPEYVVAHLDANAEAPSEELQTPPGIQLMHLPPVAKLPVIVAVRMSLSFPLLLSAVPLWAVNYGAKRKSDDDEAVPDEAVPDETVPDKAEPVWFSDGGIASNFPVHFFDALLPTRPTFALSLGPCTTVHPTDQSKNIFVPSGARSGILPRWTRINGVIGFGRAVADTLQNWSDNNQARMPGYRDRIIQIHHTKVEGGLNLDMKDETIKNLSARGEAAAKVFLRFDLEQHRWTRYRSTMSLLEQTAAQYLRGYTTPVPGVPSYSEMITHPPKSYRSDWSRPKARFARKRTEDVVEVAENWPDRKHSFKKKAPRPSPVLRVTPDV